MTPISGSANKGKTPAAGRRITYQPALDGLRALAVSAVLAYHAGFSWAKGGFLGVDAFFVLSGFLITSLLLAEWQAGGKINLSGFWSRRARRLLPALFLVLVAVGGYAIVFAEPEELDQLRADAFATIGYVANWRPVFAGESYFDQFSMPSPLRHTWSLAIEEQWYAFWPLALLLLVRLRRSSLFLAATILMAVASALLMALLFDPNGDQSRVYYGTDTRAQSLLVGAALAMVLAQRRWPAWFSGWTLQIAAVVCVGVVIWAWGNLAYDSVFLYRGGFLMLAAAVALMIVAAVQPRGGVFGRVLALPPLRGLGLISYGVYLWHWPIYLVLTPERTGWGEYPLFAGRVFATLAISVASYVLIETPFRKGVFRRWRASWALAPAGATCLAVALFLVTRGGMPIFGAAAVAQEMPVVDPPPPQASCEEDADDAPVRILTVGDSVALTMAQGLQRSESEWNVSVWNKGSLGCGFVDADEQLFGSEWKPAGVRCDNWRNEWPAYVQTFQPDVVVMLFGAWDAYDIKVDGRLLEFGTPEADAYLLAELNRAVDTFSADGGKVAILTTPYFKPRDLALYVGKNRFDTGRIDHLNGLYRQVAAQRPDEVSVIDLNDFLELDGSSGAEAEGVDVSRDGVHFTNEGSFLAARWLAPQLLELAPAKEEGGCSIEATQEAAEGTSEANEEPSPARWLELLDIVPDTPETRAIAVMNDYARFRQEFDVALPPSNATEAELDAYLRSLLFDDEGKGTGLVPAEITGIAKFPPPLLETRTELGFTIADIDQDVWAGEMGLESPVQVLRGRIDSAAVDLAVRSDPQFQDMLSPVPYAGTSYYSWGTDFEAGVGPVSPVTPWGRGHRLAVLDDNLYWSVSTAGMQSMLDVAALGAPSLGNREEFRTLAAALADMDTYTAFFSDDVGVFTPSSLASRLADDTATAEQIAALETSLAAEPKLLPFAAFAGGAGVDDKGPFIALVLLNEDERTAIENAGLFVKRMEQGSSGLRGQPFADFVSDVKVSVEGRLVKITFRTDQQTIWLGLYASKDTFLLHE